MLRASERGLPLLHPMINPKTSQEQILLSYNLTCYPRDIAGICSVPPPVKPLSSSLQVPGRVASIPYTPAQPPLLEDGGVKGGGRQLAGGRARRGCCGRGSCGTALPEGCPALGAGSTPRSSPGSSCRSDVCPAPAALPSQGSKAPVCEVLGRARLCCCGCKRGQRRGGDSLPGGQRGSGGTRRETPGLSLIKGRSWGLGWAVFWGLLLVCEMSDCYKKLGGNRGSKHTSFCPVSRCVCPEVACGSSPCVTLSTAEGRCGEPCGSPQKVDYG